MSGFGEHLRKRAQELGLPDAEVARRLGMSQARYQNYAAGKREPDYQTLARICRVLETNPSQLLGFDERPAPGNEHDRLRVKAKAAIAALPAGKLKMALALLEAVQKVDDELEGPAPVSEI